MKTIIKLIFILLLNISCFSQSYKNGLDYEHIFKNWIYLEKKSDLLISKDEFKFLTIKNDSIYELFKNNTALKISDVNNNLPKNFVVKQLILNEKNIKNNNELTPHDASIKGFSYTNQCLGSLILIFNIKTGISYRISGFKGNDTLTFLFDFKDSLYESTEKQYTENKIINSYYIEDVDLKCLLKGLRSKNPKDTVKFPCLQSCLGEIIVE